MYSQEIKVGMSGDFSGSIKYIGKNMAVGIEAYFKHINQESEYQFKLIVKDDKYKPQQTVQNVNEFVLDKEVVALIGNIGTPTSNVILPILKEHNLILFGPYTGGSILREQDELAFNYRPSYFSEAYYIVKNLIKKGLKTEDIVIFSQNDTYGQSGFLGAKKALSEYFSHTHKFVTHVRYERGTNNVEKALSYLYDLEKDPKVVLMISTEKQAIKFINLAKDDFPHLKYFHLSPVRIKAIQKQIQPYENNFYVTQLVPPLNSKLKIIKEYKRILHQFYPNAIPNKTSLEGFIVAKLFVSGVKSSKKSKIKREDLYTIFKKLKDINIGLGFISDFQNNEREYASSIWLTTVRDKKEISISWEDILIN